MNIRNFLFCFLAVLMGGCVLSLHPLYTDKSTVFEEKLLGSWVNSNNKDEIWRFEKTKNAENVYKLTNTLDGKSGEFTAHLLKIDNTLFLDMFPEASLLDKQRTNDYYKIHLLPVHSFIKIEHITPKLGIRIIDQDKIDKMLQKDPNLIKHEIVDSHIVLTAPTRQLEQFIGKYSAGADLFGDVTEMERLPSEPNNTAVKTADPNRPPDGKKAGK